MLRKLIYTFIFFLTLSGCSSAPKHQNTIFGGKAKNKNYQLSESDKQRYITIEDKRAAMEFRALKEKDLTDAYKQGVQDTLSDFKGRMRARSQFVWEPPIIEMVDMPASVQNGALYPRHKTPVIIAPGRWVEENGIRLPTE